MDFAGFMKEVEHQAAARKLAGTLLKLADPDAVEEAAATILKSVSGQPNGVVVLALVSALLVACDVTDNMEKLPPVLREDPQASTEALRRAALQILTAGITADLNQVVPGEESPVTPV